MRYLSPEFQMLRLLGKFYGGGQFGTFLAYLGSSRSFDSGKCNLVVSIVILW